MTKQVGWDWTLLLNSIRTHLARSYSDNINVELVFHKTRVVVKANTALNRACNHPGVKLATCVTGLVILWKPLMWGLKRRHMAFKSQFSMRQPAHLYLAQHLNEHTFPITNPKKPKQSAVASKPATGLPDRRGFHGPSTTGLRRTSVV